MAKRYILEEKIESEGKCRVSFVKLERIKKRTNNNCILEEEEKENNFDLMNECDLDGDEEFGFEDYGMD